MKREIAERFAATAVADLSLADARSVIAEFLASLALCPMCGGTGRFTFRRDLELRVADPLRGGSTESRFIPEGTEAPCPKCRGRDENEAAGDPDWVAWHCLKDDKEADCRYDRGRDETRRISHADCGWRIMLPLGADTA